jgi:hypothetical protein
MTIRTLLAAATTTGQDLGSKAITGVGPLGGADGANFGNSAVVITRFVTQLSNLIGLLTIVAGIYFVLTFILAGFDWLSSGGDKGKVEKAQNRMTSAAIGLLIVIIALGIIGVVGGVFGLDILNLDKLINSIIPGRTSTPNLPYVPPGQQILTP